MRGFVDGLRGIHKYVPRESPKPGSVYNERIKRRALVSEHPLVTVHAETGERALESVEAGERAGISPCLSAVGISISTSARRRNNFK